MKSLSIFKTSKFKLTFIKLRKFIIKSLNKIGITPYVYYTYKYNNPFEVQKRIVGLDSPTIFDVGAFDGRTVEKYKKLIPNSTIYSFEPTESSFHKLKKKYDSDPSVKLYNIALSCEKGYRDFFINESDLTNSLLPSTEQGKSEFPQIKIKDRAQVAVNTIDEICAEAQVSQIDILKIDTQGTELEVLKGAQSKLEAVAIRIIYLEVEFVEVYKNQPLFHDISLYLHNLDYELYALYNLSFNKKGRLIYGDAIYLPKETR